MGKSFEVSMKQSGEVTERQPLPRRQDVEQLLLYRVEVAPGQLAALPALAPTRLHAADPQAGQRRRAEDEERECHQEPQHQTQQTSAHRDLAITCSARAPLSAAKPG